ncbi:MAG: ABC transporter permease [Methanobacteriota archaeon]|nr:MAG: ABC transporter permease [Euryarchaeota archaeon]
MIAEDLEKWRKRVLNPFNETLAITILSALFAGVSILVLLIILGIAGHRFSFSDVFEYGFREIVTSPQGILEILYWATPLIFTGLAVGIAFKAGLFNIGGQGQLIMGALVSAIWAASIVPNTPALRFLMTNKINILVTMLVGTLVGALWALLPGLLKAYYGAHEVITTILMNLVSINMVLYLVGSKTYSPFINRSKGDAYGQTEVIVSSAKIDPVFPELSQLFNYSIFIAIIVAIAMHFLIYRTSFGYRVRATGLNETAAQAAGINTKRVIVWTMVLSGAVAGMGGALLVQGTFPYRYNQQMESTLGFEGIAVALIGQNAPIAIIAAAVVFGFLHASKLNIDINTDIPADMIFVFQALIILFVSAPLISRIVYRKLMVAIFGKELLNPEIKEEEKE